MSEQKIVVGFGSKITDTTAVITAELLTAINEKIKNKNIERARNSLAPLPEVDLKSNKQPDSLYSIFKEVLEEHRNELEIHGQEGGSVYNSFEAAKTVLGDKAKNYKFVHIPTAVSPTIIFVLNGQKLMATDRPENPEKLVFTEEQKRVISEADVFFAPKSSFNSFGENIKEIYGLLKNSAKVLATFHGTGTPAKNIKLMQRADLWIGNKEELMGYEAERKTFNKKSGTVEVITNGEHEADVISGSYYEQFPALPIENFVNDAGAGNGFEGTALAYMLGAAEGNTKAEKLTWLGNMGNAAGGTATTFIGTALQAVHMPSIKKLYSALVDNKIRQDMGARMAHKKLTSFSLLCH